MRSPRARPMRKSDVSSVLVRALFKNISNTSIANWVSRIERRRPCQIAIFRSRLQYVGRHDAYSTSKEQFWPSPYAKNPDIFSARGSYEN
jgi:hypothetical protein